MTDSAPAEPPLAIDRVHGSRPSAGAIRLALSGDWQGPGGGAEQEPLLVVQVEGRRHRFPADRDDHAGELPEGRWRASFSVPDWAEPRREGQATVWIGNAVVPVPPLHGSQSAPTRIVRPGPDPGAPGRRDETQPQAKPEASGAGGQVPAESPVRGDAASPGRPLERPSGPGVELADAATARSGPLAELLLRETVAALHGELEQRTAEVVRLRGALGDARAELTARADTQAQLEGTLGELSAELKRLMRAVEEQRSELEEHRARAAERDELERERRELTEAHERRVAELIAAHQRETAELRAVAETQEGALREELAASQVAREAALSELAGLQAELGRIGAELAVTRERVASESGDLGHANRLLAEARALAAEIRRGRDG